MLLDRSKEEIARDLMAQAERAWGPGRVEALRAQIDESAEALSRIGRYSVALDGDEPDYLGPTKTRGEDW